VTVAAALSLRGRWRWRYGRSCLRSTRRRLPTPRRGGSCATPLTGSSTH